MLAIHDRTRRWICRVVFIALCIGPTLVVFLWAVWQHTPAHVGAAARQLGDRLDVRVSLVGLTHPRPGTAIYRGLELADLETGQRLLTAREVRTARSGNIVLVSAAKMEIAAAHVDLLGQVLEQTLRSWSRGELRMAVGQVTVGGQGYSRVRAALQSASAGAQLIASFHAPGASAGAPVRVRLVRNRQTVPPSLELEMNTAAASLACMPVRPLLPALAQLGAQASFCGLLRASRQPAGWTGALAGTLTGIDLTRLVDANFAPHRLTGAAEIVIQRASFRHGRLEMASGTLTAGPGVISRSLCQAATISLQLTAADLLVGADPTLAYQQLAFSFALDAHGLQLRGVCRQAARGTVLLAATGPLLLEPAAQRLPITALIRTLVPRADVLVPATLAAERLTHALPLAGAVAPHLAREALANPQ